MNLFFSYRPGYQQQVIAFVRVVVGLIMVYHGLEVFNAKLMEGYAKWDAFKGFSNPALIVYLGKSTELITGILLTTGLFTRLGALLLIGNMLYITFFIGHGKFWYEDQHPFLLALLGLIFIFCGAGKWSLDYLIFKNRT